jgi:hypothetical protein
VKPRQLAVLQTVRRWSWITLVGVDPWDGACALCRVSSTWARGFCFKCERCPYTEVFEQRCYKDFPGLNDPDVEQGHPGLKLNRALELAKQFGVGAAAFGIYRGVADYARQVSRRSDWYRCDLCDDGDGEYKCDTCGRWSCASCGTMIEIDESTGTRQLWECDRCLVGERVFE